MPGQIKTSPGHLQVLGGQVGEASVLLDDYNVRLQEELKDRKRVRELLVS